MKKIIGIIAMVSTGCASFSSAAAQTSGGSIVGEVVDTTGKVQIERSGTSYQSVDGATLVRGDTVTVPKGQRVEVQLDGCSGDLKGPVTVTLDGPDLCSSLAKAVNVGAAASAAGTVGTGTIIAGAAGAGLFALAVFDKGSDGASP